MSDLEEIRSLYGTPAPPSPETVAAARARALPARRPSRRRAWLVLAPVAGVAAVALGMALLSGAFRPDGDDPATGGVPTPGPVVTTALPPVGPSATAPVPKLSAQGRRWYVQWRETQVKQVGSGGNRYFMETRERDAAWYGYRASDSFLRRNYQGARPVGDGDAAAWKAAGSPTEIPTVNCKPIPDKVVCGSAEDGAKVGVDPEFETTHRVPHGGDRIALDGPFPLSAMSLADLGALPTGPAALRAALLARLEGRTQPSDEEMWVWHNGMYLLLETPVEQPVRRAALDMLAALPGARVLKNVTDTEGRKGDAVAWTTAIPDAWGLEGDREYRLVYRPAAHRPLAFETRYLKPTTNFAGATPGTLWHAFTVLASGWTDDVPRIT